MRIIICLMCSLSLLGTSLPAFSSNLRFLNDSATADFNQSDWNMLDAASEKALGQYPNGKKLSWTNSATGSGGYVQPLNTFTQNGMKCRTLRIFNQANYQTDKYDFVFCKYNNGWRVTG